MGKLRDKTKLDDEGIVMWKYKIIILIILSYSIKVVGQNQVLIDSLQIELSNATDVNDEANILRQLSRYYLKSNFKQSIEYAQKAVEKLKTQKISTDLSESYRSLGNAYLLSGNYNEALKYFLEGLQVARELDSNYEIFASTVSIAIVYDRLGNFDEAMKYNFEALQIYNENRGGGNEKEFIQGVITLYNNIGNIYQTRDELTKAEEYYLKGISTSKAEGELFRIDILYNNLGKIKSIENDTIAALKYLKMSEEVREKANNQPGLAVTYYFIAEHYLRNLNYKKAIEYAAKSFEIASETGALLTKNTAAEILTKAYEELEDYTNAYKYHKILKEVSDSIFNDNTITEITRLKFLNEQATLDNQRLQEAQRIKLKNTIIISALLIGLVLFISFFIVTKSRLRRILLEQKEIETNIVQKKKELATNVLYLLRKNETLESVTKKLLVLKKNLKGENQADIHRVIIELQSEIDTNSWKEFELRFQDVHQGFYENLQKKFPELTPTERKLAAFLKLNMSSKEISVITGQSIRSLEVARYRLRKKLGITNKEINLTNFLSEL